MDFDNDGDELLSQVDLEDREDFNLTSSQEQRRFGEPVTGEFIEALQQNRIPANTKRNTKWCVGVYDSWAKNRNTRISQQGTRPSEKYVFVPPLSAEIPADALDFWMCRFVCEIKRQDGTFYPALSVKHICIGIWRYLRDVCKRPDLNFMDEQNTEFTNFRATLDGIMKQINQKGIGLSRRQAQPVTPLEEEKLWSNKTFTSETSSGLLHAVYFYNCKVFGLRAADEHANLEVSQFEFGKNSVGEYVRFKGRVTKNNQGGLRQCGKIQFKDIKQYAQLDNQRCCVGLLKIYLAAIPNEAAFYRRPLSSKDGELRYSQQKVGIHTLQKMFKTICEKAGQHGTFTGHSGKVTLATTLFNSKVDEQLIMARTGHRRNAVRAYKRTSEETHKEISDKLQPPPPKKLDLQPKQESVDGSIDDDSGEQKTTDSKKVVLKCTKPDGTSFEITF